MQEVWHKEKLTTHFYQRDTVTVAEELLGKILVHRLASGEILAGRIVETEAYLGIEDPAAHSYGGRKTPRTEVMFYPGGHAYIYQIYGLHYCFNVVTQTTEPEAVLVRALEPLSGIERMQRLRRQTDVKKLTSGPGRLCEAMALNKDQNKLDLTQSNELFIVEGDDPRPHLWEIGDRIGVDYAGDAAFWPLRFAIKGHDHISKPIK